MTDRIRCEFYVLRYVPNVVREEFVNVGIVLRTLVPDRQSASLPDTPKTLSIGFTKDWGRVLAMDPDADIDLLSRLSCEIEQSVTDGKSGYPSEIGYVVRLLEDCSHSFQISEKKTNLATSLKTELSRLMELYVEPGHSGQLSERHSQTNP